MLLLGPAQIHTQKDFRPVLRFGAAGAGLDGKNGVETVAFARQERARLEGGNVLIGPGDLLGDVFQNRVALRAVGFLFGKVEIRVDVARLGGE